jgi:ParB/RepB/Spo0J family partition protein
MELGHRFELVPCASIKVLRDDRQRQVVDTKGLKGSIKSYGLLNPIIVDRDFILITGERRLTACKELGLENIPVRFLEDLSPTEAKILELEENIKRSDLDWRDEVRAVGQLYDIKKAENASWTYQDMVALLNLNQITQYLRVYRDLDNPKISGANGLMPAYNILLRLDERGIGDAMNELADIGAGIFDKAPGPAPEVTPGPGPGIGPNPTSGPIPEAGPGLAPLPKPSSGPLPPIETILNVSFLDWAPTYTGPKFNLIHCDFPYGVDVFGGDMFGHGNKVEHYRDQKEIYWELLSCFCTHLDRFMAPSAHLVFWYSMNYHAETMEFLRKNAPSLAVNPFPLVWVKSDNAGMLPDAKRGPRRVYETALMASREDRLISKIVSNAYVAPSEKAHHPSAKPEPVLKHFFQMFVDENTTLFDPTCGGGSALRAAESMGAKRVLGLELDEEHCHAARQALRASRGLRGLGSKT